MPVYEFEAIDNSGTEIRETFEAESKEEVQEMITAQGWHTTRIETQSEAKERRRKERNPKEKSIFRIIWEELFPNW